MKIGKNSIFNSPVVPCFYVLPLLLPAVQALSQEEWEISSGAPEELTQEGQALQTDYYRIDQWGMLQANSALWHETWYYPTPNDRIEEGVFAIEVHKAGTGDFDGDGDQDILLNWVAFPHTLPRPPMAPSILLNDDGKLRLSADIWQGEPPGRSFSYKVGVQDFNLDGRDDAVMASMGIITRHPDGTYSNVWEEIPLVISSQDGLVDASERIEGQESAVIPSFSFGHDLAVGDINGDGAADFYQGKHLFLGDAKGGFTLRNDLLPPEASGSDMNPVFVMSSAMGDLDNDGTDDLIIGLADGQDPENAVSGWIFLSAGSGGLVHGTKQLLPDGLYGRLNTKLNSMELADIDDDGRLDILIGQTQSQPYYDSRSIQVLMNRGAGKFVDETGMRLSQADRPGADGEGTVQALDINGDGHLDIVDSTVGGPEGMAILVNDGTGIFKRMPPELLPVVQNNHLVGNEGWSGDFVFSDTPYLYPIDLEGNGLASFVVQMMMPFDHWPLVPGESVESALYVINPIEPYSPVSGPKRLSDHECLLDWGARTYPNLFAGETTDTTSLGAIRYRNYSETKSYLGVRGRRVLVVSSKLGNKIQDVGSMDKFLPKARAAGC